MYDLSELDEERNCPGCSDTGNTGDTYYNWEEQDYSENRLMYELCLEQADEAWHKLDGKSKRERK
jgi:hypothetical protein